MKYLKSFNDPAKLVGTSLLQNSVLYYTGETKEVPESAGGVITKIEGIKTFSSTKPSQSYMDSIAIVGALLSYKDGTYTVWNGDSSAADYWNPKKTATTDDPYEAPSDKYGTVIAVCCGQGLWVSTEYLGLTNTYTWCSSSSDKIYTQFHGSTVHCTSGWVNTNHMWNNHAEAIWENGTKGGTVLKYDSNYSVVWGILYNTEVSGLGQGTCYLPSKIQLVEIQQNVCSNSSHKDDSDDQSSSSACLYNDALGSLLSLSNNYYWSSSQCPLNYYNAYCVRFGYGSVGDGYKGNDYRSLALLHFE